MITPAQRMSVVKPYVFAKMNKRKDELKAGGMDIIALDMGSPDLPPTDFIVDTLVTSARNPNKHGYGGFTGSAAFRKSFAQYYARRFNVKLDAEKEVLPLLGSKEGIYHTAFAYLNPGDYALVPDPGYPTYTAGTEIAGGTPYFMPLLKENNWLPDLNAIPANVLAKSKLMWLNYPNNPTTGTAPLSYFSQYGLSWHSNMLCCLQNVTTCSK